MADEKKIDTVEAIAIGLETIGFVIGQGFERRAKASVIEHALKLCGFEIVPEHTSHKGGET